MADQNKEIILKLIIDGKEAYSTLKITDAEIQKIRQTAGLLDDGFTKSYQNITNELLKFNVVSEQSVESITKWLLTQDLTEETIDKTIAQLETESRLLNINSVEWKNNQTASTNLQGAYANLIQNNLGLNKTQNTVIAGTQKMNMAMMQTGYIMNDAQMFFISFRMGLMGIANNVPFVINLLKEARDEVKAMGGSIKDVLVKSLMGTGGLMIAINGIMTLLYLLPELFGETTKSIEDQKTAVDALRDAYSKLTKAEMENRIADYKSQIAELESKHPKTSEMRQVGGIKSEKFERVQLTPEERYRDDLAQYNSLKQQVKLLEEINLNRGIEEEKTIEIAQWREKIEQMNNDPKSKNYWKNLVADATSYENAVEKLENAIDNYQKKTGFSGLSNPKVPKTLGAKVGGDIPIRGVDNIPGNTLDLKIEQQKLNEDELQKMRIMNIEDRFERERQLADFELQQETMKYYNYENFEELRTELEKQHAITRKRIAEEEAEAKISVALNTLGALQGAFAEHTAIAKAAAVASTIIQTYQAATAALSPPPIGLGPVFGPILAGATIITGMANVAKIEGTEIPGYDEGGRLPKGKPGYFEGWHNEIIAPEKTFVEIFKSELRPQIYNQSSTSQSNSNLGAAINTLNEQLASGIKALAYMDDREAKKAYLRASAQLRRSKS